MYSHLLSVNIFILFLSFSLTTKALISSHRKLSIISKNPVTISDAERAKVSQIRSSTQLQVIPQIIFAASCAGAVFSYVYFNIDSIKEKQKASIDAAMTQQADTIRSVQEKQKADIEKALRTQQEKIKETQQKTK